MNLVELDHASVNSASPAWPPLEMRAGFMDAVEVIILDIRT